LKDVAIPPPVLDVACVAGDDVGLLDFADVVEDVAELHLPEALELRLCGIAVLVGERVMLAVDGHPLLGALPGREPQRELEHPLDRGMHNQRFVRGAAMQVDGGAEDRHLNQDGGDDEREKKGRKHTALRVETVVSLDANTR
jgi:hypothetical protein